MKHLFLGLAFTAILFSCKKEKPAPEPASPVAAITTGNLSGRVRQYDQFGTAYTTGLNTTTVAIEGSNSSCLTDQNGRYALTGVSSGTYTLSFKKPGCGLMKLTDVRYKFTDTTTYNAAVADVPTFAVSSAYVKDTSWFSATLPGIYYNANTVPVNSKATLVAIVGKSAAITIADPLSYLNDAPASLIYTPDYNRFLSYAFLKQSYQFQKDSLIYVKIYPVANTGAGYFDNSLHKTIYTSYGQPSATFTLSMPQ